MNNNTIDSSLFQLSSFLPDRTTGLRGNKPIHKLVLIAELFKLIKFNLGWRNIKHFVTVRRYLYELQRRGLLKKFLNKLNNLDLSKRIPKTIVDSSEFKSWRNQRLVNYSGKSHNYSTKISLEITSDFKIVHFIFSKDLLMMGNY